MKLFKNIDHFITIVAIALFVFVSAMYEASPPHTLNHTHEVMVGFLNFGLVRGVVGIGFGVILGLIVEKVNKKLPMFFSIFMIVMATLFICYYTKLAVTPKYDYINYFAMGLIVWMTYRTKDFMNQMLESCIKSRAWCFIGGSLEIYIFHMVVVEGAKLYGLEMYFIKHIWVYLFVVWIFSLLMKYFSGKLKQVFQKLFFNQTR